MSRTPVPAVKPVVDKSIDALVSGGSLVLESTRNQANGFAGLNSSGALLGTVTHRSGTAAEINAIVLTAGELAFATDLNELRRGDGTTAGGLPVIGGVRQYASGVDGNGFITLSSTTAPNTESILIPVQGGASYRIKGFFSFTDADSISNCQVAITRISPMLFGAIHKPTLQADGNLGWVASSTWHIPQAGVTQSQFPVNVRSFSQTSIVFAPQDQTKQLQNLSFEYTFGCHTSGDLRITPVRRTATTGGVTCMYYMEVQRIK